MPEWRFQLLRSVEIRHLGENHSRVENRKGREGAPCPCGAVSKPLLAPCIGWSTDVFQRAVFVHFLGFQPESFLNSPFLMRDCPFL